MSRASPRRLGTCFNTEKCRSIHRKIVTPFPSRSNRLPWDKFNQAILLESYYQRQLILVARYLGLHRGDRDCAVALWVKWGSSGGIDGTVSMTGIICQINLWETKLSLPKWPKNDNYTHTQRYSACMPNSLSQSPRWNGRVVITHHAFVLKASSSTSQGLTFLCLCVSTVKVLFLKLGYKTVSRLSLNQEAVFASSLSSKAVHIHRLNFKEALRT